MAGKMGMQRETEDTILARLDSDIKEKRVRVSRIRIRHEAYLCNVFCPSLCPFVIPK